MEIKNLKLVAKCHVMYFFKEACVAVDVWKGAEQPESLPSGDHSAGRCAQNQLYRCRPADLCSQVGIVSCTVQVRMIRSRFLGTEGTIKKVNKGTVQE